jgi:peptidoglycan-associated lipoprotein
MVEQPAQTTAAPSVVELVDAYFDFDRSTLRNDARSALEADARTLKSELKETKILIEGHCDEVGTVAYNLVLGEKRAQAVKRYLQDLGVSSSRMQTASLGKERPFCTDHNPECWQNNRRAHFSVQ